MLSPPPPALEARALRHIYAGSARGLHGLNLRVGRGEVVGLIGPNGAGKSTAFELLAGGLRPQEGGVWLAGEEVTRLPLWRRARRGLGYVSQRGALFEGLTCLDDLRCAAWRAGEGAEREARGALELLGLGALAARRVSTLSGGERRRLSLARLIAQGSRVALLDEPFAALDPLALAAIREALFVIRDLGVGVLLTDHQAPLALSLCDRVTVLYEGAALAEGTPGEVLQDPRAQTLYFGTR